MNTRPNSSLTSPSVDQSAIDALNAESWATSRQQPENALKLALDAFQKSIPLNYKKGIAEAKKNSAQAYWLLADYGKAMADSIEAIELFKSLNLLTKLGDTYNILGGIYGSMEENANAIKYYELALELNRQCKDKEGQIRSLNSLGDNHIRAKRYDLAIEFFKECLALEPESKVMRGIVLYNLGEAYYRLDEDAEALNYLAMSMSIGEALGFPLMICYNSWILGEIELKRDNSLGAISHLQKSLKSAKEVGARDRMYHIHLALSKAFKLEGELEKALHHFEQFHSIKEEVLGEEAAKHLQQLQVEYKTTLVQKESEEVRAKNLILEKANSEIELQKSIIESKNFSITSSINYARRIQHAILPSKDKFLTHFSDAFIYYKPKDIVSGDFYWYAEYHRYAFVVVADCTGHGVPGAMMSVLGSSLLNKVVRDRNVSTPADALRLMDLDMNALLNRENNDVMDGMDLALCVFDLGKMELTYSGANRPLILIRRGELIKYDCNKRGVGDYLSSDIEFTNAVIQYQKGDQFYMFSDGLQDQFGGVKGRKFMSRRLLSVLLENHQLPMSEQKEKLNFSINQWRKDWFQVDDLCLLGLQV